MLPLFYLNTIQILSTYVSLRKIRIKFRVKIFIIVEVIVLAAEVLFSVVANGEHENKETAQLKKKKKKNYVSI